MMPVHSLETTQHNWNFDRYADQIADIKHRFSKVVACVHPECGKKGYWAPHFSKRGISVVSGAHLNDKNSLLRMAVLFSRFEFVTTNGFGSHLAYGAFFGAKPSIYGDAAVYSGNDFRGDMIYANCPEVLPSVWHLLHPAFLKSVYHDFFCDPWLAVTHEKWAQFQLGEGHKLRPRRFRQIFFNLRTRLMHFSSSLINGRSKLPPTDLT